MSYILSGYIYHILNNLFVYLVFHSWVFSLLSAKSFEVEEFNDTFKRRCACDVFRQSSVTAQAFAFLARVSARYAPHVALRVLEPIVVDRCSQVVP